MLTISSVKSGHAGSYYTEPQCGTYRSEWSGNGAKHLGLNGDVKAEDFRALLEGYSPSGEPIFIRRNSNRIAGFDATISAPKSISLAVLYDGDERILNAHKEAVQGVIHELESGLQVRVRQGKDSVYYPTEGLAIANFQHTLSRAYDPHLHNHLVIMNAARFSGEWRSVYARRGLYERVKEIGQCYRDALADRVHKLGMKVRETGNGLWELAQYPVDILREFSQRRVGIEHMVGADSSTRKRHYASLHLRGKKNEAPLMELYYQWKQRYKKVNVQTKVIAHNQINPSR
ncbi:MAG: MobF family relaxase [Cyanobacteria bacterium J06650_10]